MDGEADDCVIDEEGDIVMLPDLELDLEPGHRSISCVVRVVGKPSTELIAGLHGAMRGLFGAMMSH